ncbi:iron complex outermembrane recepter protein [Dyella sp. OK004]|uniref:TonB-dependent receptor n=1 Tax=Dyella sp. OK004 TaxID=1855292 RepID=UPI0008E50534|nr:TonB-dependent receptor [Dyella sp. OK004]SFS17388.1 iron complex outermembrane recepter protein [Dyella sp. OK004]
MPNPNRKLRSRSGKMDLPALSALAAGIRLRRLPVQLLFAASFCIAGAAAATDTPVTPVTPAATTASAKQLEEVEVHANTATSAITQAPTQADLTITQPQSVIGLDYISNHVAPTADYAAIAGIAPGVSTIGLSGPGLGEAKQMTIRGFNDNQYNVTYDGIPFGDTNDFSHHTSSYFPAKMIGQVTVDRGPGGASQIGQATFGGTVALRSKDARDEFSFIPTVSYGSYDTTLTHLELNSGRIDSLGGGKLIASAQYNDTDTFRTNSPMSRKTGYIKYVQPVGSSTEITFLSNYNYIRFNNPDKTDLTQQQIDTLGRNFGLNRDRTSTDCYCYNYQTKQTDLEYIGVSSALSDTWQLDNKLYTYAYNNDSHESPYVGTAAAKTNLGGYNKINNYRAWGDTLETTHTDEHGQLRLGAWYEYIDNTRYSVALDYGLGGIHDVKKGKPDSSAYKYTMIDRLRTTQLYAEYAWRVTDQFTLTPGIKYDRATRYIDAPINQTTKLPLYYQQTWDKPLGSLTANYMLTSEWSVYGQAAQGFLTPNLNQFYVPNPGENKVAPQKTMNYQFGTVYKTDRFNADADVFYIDYQNFPLTAVDPVTHDPIYAMAKGATMRGAEAEATYYMGEGVSLYANGSLIDAKFKNSNLRMPTVPSGTAAFGFLYDIDGFFGSLTEKYIGGQRVYNSDFSPDVASSVKATGHSTGWWQAALSLGYGQNLSGSVIKSYKIRLQVDNLFDEHKQVIDAIKGTTPYYLVLPGRSWFGSISLAF